MLSPHGATRSILAVCLLVALIVAAQATPKTITREYKNADLVQVLKELAREMVNGMAQP